MTSTSLDYDTMPEWGYDWWFAQILSVESEYRQVSAGEQLRWLEYWMPKVEH